MNHAERRQLIFLKVACVALLLLSGWTLWKYGLLSLQVGFASEQTRMIENARVDALRGDVQNAADCLGVIDGYYPSGTKQAAGSRLDKMVERERALAVRDVVAFLRSKTGEDLGEDARAWIEKYRSR